METPIPRPRSVTITDPSSDTLMSDSPASDPENNSDKVSEPGHLSVMSEEPVADQHLEDRDLADLMEAAHRGRYMSTRSRSKESLQRRTDSSTFDFHAKSTQGAVATDSLEPTAVDAGKSVVTSPTMLRSTTPKNLLAASVKGGVLARLHRSVTGTHQLLSCIK